MAGVLVRVDHYSAYLRHRDEVKSLLDERFYPLPWVDQRVWMGAIRLMADDKAIIGFEVKQYPGGARELHGMFACGEMESIMGLIDRAIDYAHALDCDVATIESRLGWAKVLKSRGFVPNQLKIMKELG